MLHWSDILKHGLNDTRAWQFVQENGQAAVFEGYQLSLDLMAKNTFEMLHGLHSVLVVLLVVEAVVVNLLALTYLFLLLKNVGAQHMRCFAPFLALPSAVMRTMASRPCKVGCKLCTGTACKADMRVAVVMVPVPVLCSTPLTAASSSQHAEPWSTRGLKQRA